MPTSFIAERLKTLRTERGWSQAQLAEHIDSDGRQISRYENSKVAPSLEAVTRIAETFKRRRRLPRHRRRTRRPCTPANAVDARLADLDTLTDDERATITNVIDAITTKAKLRLITG